MVIILLEVFITIEVFMLRMFVVIVIRADLSRVVETSCPQSRLEPLVTSHIKISGQIEQDLISGEGDRVNGRELALWLNDVTVVRTLDFEGLIQRVSRDFSNSEAREPEILTQTDFKLIEACETTGDLDNDLLVAVDVDILSSFDNEEV